MLFNFLKVALVSNLLIGSFAFSQTNKQNIMVVNCKSSLAGGVSMSLTGQVEIVKSPTTGALKIKENSFLVAQEGSSVKKIKVSGTLMTYSSLLDANEEPSNDSIDDRTYSSIKIYYSDTQLSAKSSIFRIAGSKSIPLNCGKN